MGFRGAHILDRARLVTETRSVVVGPEAGKRELLGVTGVFHL